MNTSEKNWQDIQNRFVHRGDKYEDQIQRRIQISKVRVLFSTDGKLIIPNNLHQECIESFINIEDETRQSKYQKCTNCLRKAGLAI